MQLPNALRLSAARGVRLKALWTVRNEAVCVVCMCGEGLCCATSVTEGVHMFRMDIVHGPGSGDCRAGTASGLSCADPGGIAQVNIGGRDLLMGQSWLSAAPTGAMLQSARKRRFDDQTFTGAAGAHALSRPPHSRLGHRAPAGASRTHHEYRHPRKTATADFAIFGLRAGRLAEGV